MSFLLFFCLTWHGLCHKRKLSHTCCAHVAHVVAAEISEPSEKRFATEI